MKAVYTEPVRTVFTFEEAESALRWALAGQLGKAERDVAAEIVALALAKTALETGRWKSCWNGNWGNIKAGTAYEGMFTCILLNEVLHRNGKDVLVWFAPKGELSGNPATGGRLIGPALAVPQGHAQTRMRAHANLYDGALSYVDLKSNTQLTRTGRAGRAPTWRHRRTLRSPRPGSSTRAALEAGPVLAKQGRGRLFEGACSGIPPGGEVDLFGQQRVAASSAWSQATSLA